ncbi:hypothetical protein AB1Y20_015397 [Prymnesium parvum]|uniref:Uncharacterized protein n=1 Tax=Prymnesium parvum TaxID=97485 RepID=A0AB34K0S3_PRYPA
MALCWKSPISLMTKPKEAQFYARLNADDAWKHKYKQFCFSWTQGTPIKEPPREFAILDQATAARQATIEAAKKLHLTQTVASTHRVSEIPPQLHAHIQQQADEANAVSVLSGFAFSKEASEKKSNPPSTSGSHCTTSNTRAAHPTTATRTLSTLADDGASTTDGELSSAESGASERKQTRKRSRSPGTAADISQTTPSAAPARTADAARAEALSHLLRLATPLNVNVVPVQHPAKRRAVVGLAPQKSSFHWCP